MLLSETIKKIKEFNALQLKIREEQLRLIEQEKRQKGTRVENKP